MSYIAESLDNATATNQTALNLIQTDIKDLASAILCLVSSLSFLSSIRGTSADIRVALTGGKVETVTTITTCDKVTTVEGLNNIGGFSASSLTRSLENQNAVLSNINNVSF